MERMRSWLRPRGMTNQSRIRGLAAAGLLCTALAGCGTQVATSTPASTPPATTPPVSGAGGAPLSTAARPETGCAGANQATLATVTRHLLVPEGVDGTRTSIQRNATKVRALFRDFCAALAHATTRRPPILCPADFGVSFTGTFYDGTRVLATFDYVPAGCQRITLTAAGKTRGTLLIGKAAAAAPHLRADLAAVLGLPESQAYGSPGSRAVGPGEQGA